MAEGEVVANRVVRMDCAEGGCDLFGHLPVRGLAYGPSHPPAYPDDVRVEGNEEGRRGDPVAPNTQVGISAFGTDHPAEVEVPALAGPPEGRIGQQVTEARACGPCGGPQLASEGGKAAAQIPGRSPVCGERFPEAPVAQQLFPDAPKQGMEIAGAVEAVDHGGKTRNRFPQPCGGVRAEVIKNLPYVGPHEIDASVGQKGGQQTGHLPIVRLRQCSDELERIAVHAAIADRRPTEPLQAGAEFLGRCVFHPLIVTMVPVGTMDLQSRYEKIKERITRAAERSGRDPATITVIAVTKTVTASEVRGAYEAGIRHIGENRVQELLRKHSELSDLPIQWHFIGHLQTNKVRRVLPVASMIHSVDSSRLANQIHDLAADLGGVDVLLQVNTSAEETKFGIAPSALPELIASVRDLDRLRIRGLMTLGPLTDDGAAIRRSFRMLRECASVLRESIHDASVLSMGMTSDFEIAIEEGATHVRIGTALFGPRG